MADTDNELALLRRRDRLARNIAAEFVRLFEGEDGTPELADFNDVYESACAFLGRETKEIE